MANKDLYFPDDILNNILVRVPRKSLSRFRCVSKHWNRMIFDDLISSKKIFLPGRFCQVIDQCVTGEYCVAPAHSPFQGKQVAVGGTFNGVVLLALKNPKSLYKVDMMLYNPLTRVYNQVPDPPQSNIHKYSVSAFGFGYGETQDDLKIVTLLGRRVHNNNNNAKSRSPFRFGHGATQYGLNILASPFERVRNYNDIFQCRPPLLRSLYWNVFSLKNKSWSTPTIAEPRMDYSEFSTYAGTFVNGYLYWIITREQSCCGPESKNPHIYSKILALDVKKMMFSEIKVVDDIAFNVLGTIKGRICWVTCNTDNPGCYKLLVMNKQGFGVSYSKSCLTSLHERPYHKRFYAMCIFDEGKIIMNNRMTKKFLILDLLNDSYEGDVCGFESTDDSQVCKRQAAIEYEQSLVSPSDLYTCSSLI